ncbi:MAG: BtrH N-terminal domain-containing protein [Bacteroidales bacterium]|nr:BtrH N-terminal domain-containing protein [Bacteroidales bacterium]
MELNIGHRPSAHCENGAISALLRFHGIDLSEPMIFGLASGLFFSHVPFVDVGGMPLTSFRTVPGFLFKRITKLLGIKTETARYFNREKGMRRLDDLLLREKKPVALVVGMYYLPYIPKEYRFHFNGHNICIIGKDEETGEYIVLDSNATQKVTISRNDLIKVRYAKGGTYSLFGRMYWIKSVPEQMPDLKPLILKAIAKNCRIMTSAYRGVRYVGVRGMRFLSERIRTWEKKMGPQKALINVAQVVRMLEEIGTGGAGFRFIYGAFLQEAAQRTGIAELNDYSTRITEIGDLWRTFAVRASRMFKRRKSETCTYDDLGDMLLNLASKEEAFYKDLEKAVEKYMDQAGL